MTGHGSGAPEWAVQNWACWLRWRRQARSRDPGARLLVDGLGDLGVSVVLVVDGDVRVPGRASAHHARLNRLHGLGVRVFIWPGMELENFLPVRVLVDGRDAQAQQWADSVRALPWEKRAHIDLKNGLPDTANPAPRQRVPTHDELAFYNTIPADHRAVLTGKGYKIPHYEKMRVMPVSDEDLADLPPEAQQAIQEVLDLIESVL